MSRKRILGAAFVAGAIVAACSDHAALPTTQNGAPWSSSLDPNDGSAGSSRVYPCQQCFPIDGDPNATTFEDLYQDIFSRDGQAKCQTPGCHGDLVGKGGLAMSYTTDAECVAPGGVCPKYTGERGVYCALTMHVYRGKRLVLHHPDGHDSAPGSSLLDALDPAIGGEPKSLCNGTESNCPVSAGQLARIRAWLARGAPFDGVPDQVDPDPTELCVEETLGALCTDPNDEVPSKDPQCGVDPNDSVQMQCLPSTNGAMACCYLHGGATSCPPGQVCGDATSSSPGNCIPAQ